MVHHRVKKLSHRTADTVVGQRCALLDERRGDIQHLDPEILGLADIGHDFAAAHYYQVALGHLERPSVERKHAPPARAHGMGQVVAVGIRSVPSGVVSNITSGLPFNSQTFSFPHAKIEKIAKVRLL